MGLNFEQKDFQLFNQRYTRRFIKMNLFDFNYNIVDEISGNLVSCSIDIDADSDLRRSCSVELIVTNASFEIEPGGKIFLDKYLNPYIGYENIYTGEVQWYSQGIFLINAPSYRYDASTHSLTLEGLDLMSKCTGVRNGNLEGLPTIIKAKENVRDAIIATLKLAGFNKSIIAECKNVDGTIQEVPYDIEIEQGGTVYDILSKLRDILPNYELFFDVTGTAIYQQIPSGKNEPLLLDDELLKKVVISEDITTDFESVKNYVEIYGKSHEVANYPFEQTVSGDTLNLNIPNYSPQTSILDGSMIGFTPTVDVSAAEGSAIKIHVFYTKDGSTVDLGTYPLREGDKNIGFLNKDVYWVAVFNKEKSYWEFYGHQQAQAIWSDMNPESPFYVNGSVGKIRIVLSGGDYEDIMSDNLALQRAKFEIYSRCRLNDTLSLYMIPVPWLDVNTLIEYSPRGKNEKYQYIIKKISTDYSADGTQSITASRYYPYYEDY